jgi:hypothetical protein
MARQGLPATPAGTRTSPRNKTKRHAHTSINSEPESPSTRAKRKRNAATAHAKGAAGNKRAKPKATGVQEIPADKNTRVTPCILLQSHTKKRVVPPPGKKRKQIAPKKAAAKGGWDTPEEIDDSLYSDEEVDEEKDRLGDDEDDEENLVLPKTTTMWCDTTRRTKTAAQTGYGVFKEISRGQWQMWKDNVVRS